MGRLRNFERLEVIKMIEKAGFTRPQETKPEVEESALIPLDKEELLMAIETNVPVFNQFTRSDVLKMRNYIFTKFGTPKPDFAVLSVEEIEKSMVKQCCTIDPNYRNDRNIFIHDSFYTPPNNWTRIPLKTLAKAIHAAMLEKQRS